MQMTRTTRDALANGETLDLDCENASVTLQHHGSIHFRSNSGTVNIQADPAKLWRAVAELARDARYEWSGDRKPMIIQALRDLQDVIPGTIAQLEGDKVES